MRFRGIVIFIFFASSLCHLSKAQTDSFEIKLLNSGKSQFVDKGDFVQCIASDGESANRFFFGRIQEVGADGFTLEKMRLVPGSGGIVKFSSIQNIEKLSVNKRGVVPSLVASVIIGQLLYFKHIPQAAVGPLIGGAVYVILVRSIKHKRKSLFENVVNYTVMIVPPGSQNGHDKYFE
ncbi:hypothetical protein [Dyadobacter endophyticus]|uniref:hypothetical protein n=1 Tax=Dyadobacter endophyticus TaxID=1749036 RepID=UPI001666E6E8|nr:hypothetical protein [Dyadobacter endophyticus]